jgi:hypothetical protein
MVRLVGVSRLKTQILKVKSHLANLIFNPLLHNVGKRGLVIEEKHNMKGKQMEC